MKYVYKNLVYDNRDTKGILYKDNKILFMGNSWAGILEFLRATDNAPEVQAMFKQQLEQREQIKFKQHQRDNIEK